MKFEHLKRGGTYYRVCDPSWVNCVDTSYSKRNGGRWNPPGAFGALYLNASIAAAVANARRALRLQFGDAITFDDLQDAMRPELARIKVRQHEFVDAISDSGLRALGLSSDYPEHCAREECQRIGALAHAAGEAGIAARSAPAPDEEELAIFENYAKLQKLEGRDPFAAWYPGVG